MLGQKYKRKKTDSAGDLLETKNYADLKKTAEDRGLWRTIKRDCHKPAQ